MATERFPSFRLGTVLTTSFTGTLSERHGTSVERVPVPRRLVDWLAVTGFTVGSCTETQLRHARALREAIHHAVTAVARQEPLPAAAVQLINAHSAQGSATPILTPEGGRKWQLGSGSVEDALSVIAADAIALIAGERDGKIALCASPTCRAAFLDTSRSRTRRWCDMNTCGNREKKARSLAKQRNDTHPVR